MVRAAVLFAAAMGVGVAGGVWLGSRGPAPVSAPKRGVILDGVTLIEPGVGRRGPVQVQVVSDRIEAIETTRTKGRSDFAGTFVLPALTDMHAHPSALRIAGDDERMSLLHLRHGVTRVRLLGMGDIASVDRMRANIERGFTPGPAYTSCGPIIDGADPVIPGALSVETVEEAKGLVRKLAEAGVDCIKAYDRLQPDVLGALREAARMAGLPIVGHVPQAMDLEDAALDDVQHLRGVHPPFEDEDLRYPRFLAAWQRLDDERIAHVVETSLRLGMAHTPTLVAIEGTLVAENWERWRESQTMQRWSPHLRDGLWSGEVGFNPARFATEGDREIVRDAMARMADVIRALHEAGVPLHTGTDANAPNVVPGISLHRELQLLVEAGLRPEQALAASTTLSPRFLGIADAGTLRPGAPADFAIFREDPTLDIAALDSIVAVVADGRFYTSAELDRRLAPFRERYDAFAYRRILLPSLRLGLRSLTGLLRAAED